MYQFDIYTEMECGDVIHNHFDCPVCKKDNASTDCYGDIHDHVIDTDDKILRCKECGAKFKLVNYESCDYEEWEWELIKKDEE